MKAKTIQELFGTLQQSIVTSWRKHLKSNDYSEHVILNDFYDDMLDAVDELIEGYMSYNGKVKDYVNLFDKTKSLSPKEYIQDLHDLVVNSRDLVGKEKELQGSVDDVLKVIDTALYKLKELVKENKMTSLSSYIAEALNNKRPRYILDVGEIKEKTRYLKFSDQYWDSQEDLFLNPDGTIYARNDYDFGKLDKALQALGYDGEVVTGIEGADANSYGKKLVDGKKLYRKLKPGKYWLVGNEYPFADTYKIVKK